jgi:hypothetical protein
LLGGEFDAGLAVDCGKAIDALCRILQFPDENGKAIGQERRDIIHFEPRLNLPINLEMVRVRFADQIREPRAYAKDQLGSSVSPTIRGDRHAAG